MNRIVRSLAYGGLIVVVLLMGMTGWAQDQDAGKPVTDVLLSADPAESWLHTNGNWAGHRYSTLSQLNTLNVKNLKVAWLFSTGGKTDAQNTPLYHDGLVYFAQDNKVFAIHARSGKQVWRYEHELPEDFGGYNVPFITGKHRGVALYGDHIYFLSNDTKLRALHYKTGAPKFVKQYLKYPKDFEKAEDATGYATTVGPLAIPGKILVPLNGTDWGGLPGFVYAVHPENGELLWEANMIPGPGEPGSETWPGDSREYGGAGPWITGSWDPELKLYFTGTANAYPWNPKNRGDGKYDNVGAASVVAVNTDTGKVVWRYVVVPGDPWDYDTMSTPIIVPLNGEKVLVQPNKTGYVHYLDAKTGLRWMSKMARKSGVIKRASTAMLVGCSPPRAMWSSTPAPAACFMPPMRSRVRFCTRSTWARPPKPARSPSGSMVSNTLCKRLAGFRASDTRNITCRTATWWWRLRGKPGSMAVCCLTSARQGAHSPCGRLLFICAEEQQRT